MPQPLNSLEAGALAYLLRGEHPSLDALRRQAEGVSVDTREFTGAGFFARLRLSGNPPPLPGAPTFQIGDVCAELEGLEHGVGFVLFVNEGTMHLLECHLWGDDRFPEPPVVRRFFYLHHPRRSEPALAETADRNIEGLGLPV